jgi:hypothetical protein
MSLVDLAFPVAVIVIYFSIAISTHLRQGRSNSLEAQIERGEVAPVGCFRGTLVVVEHRPGLFLRLGQDADARRLQFQYLWITGVGPQAIFDSVAFDGSKGLVQLVGEKKEKTACFSQFSAMRMREKSNEHGSLWHVELIPLRGQPLLFLTSDREERRVSFGQTASVAKAVSSIMSLPVQVEVDGKAWTPGWPPQLDTVTDAPRAKSAHV